MNGQQRAAGLDTLKALTTLLVVFHHTAITYGAVGGWFYRERATDGGVAAAGFLLHHQPGLVHGPVFPARRALHARGAGAHGAGYRFRRQPAGLVAAGRFHQRPAVVCAGAADLPPQQVRTWRRVAGLALPALLPLAFLAKTFAVFSGPATGGWNLPSLMYAFWEPFVAWGVLLALLQWALRRSTAPGPLERTLEVCRHGQRGLCRLLPAGRRLAAAAGPARAVGA